MYRVGILTISDRGARGEREDRSGPALAEAITPPGAQVVARALYPMTAGIGGAAALSGGGAGLVLTIGGTA